MFDTSENWEPSPAARRLVARVWLVGAVVLAIMSAIFAGRAAVKPIEPPTPSPRPEPVPVRVPARMLERVAEGEILATAPRSLMARPEGEV